MVKERKKISNPVVSLVKKMFITNF